MAYVDEVEVLRMERLMPRKTVTVEQDKELPATLDEFAIRIQDATNRATTILNRISQLGDRAYGTQPECGETDERREPSGAVERVFTCLEALHSVLDRLSTAQSRIDGLA